MATALLDHTNPISSSPAQPLHGILLRYVWLVVTELIVRHDRKGKRDNRCACDGSPCLPLPVAHLLYRLENVRWNAFNCWTANCPVNREHEHSLRIQQTPDGRVLIHCLDGCGAVDVICATGLTSSQLYPREGD
jgi:hypothetical protein